MAATGPRLVGLQQLIDRLGGGRVLGIVLVERVRPEDDPRPAGQQRRDDLLPTGNEYSRVSSTCPRHVGAYSTVGTSTAPIGPAARSTASSCGRPTMQNRSRGIDTPLAAYRWMAAGPAENTLSYIACNGLDDVALSESP